MKFRTEIEPDPSGFSITHEDKIMLIGSCFSENISRKLSASEFDICTNPTGIIYNPFSITETLQLLINETIFTGKDLFEYKGLFHSFKHHSMFSSADSFETLLKINSSIETAHVHLKQSKYLFLTFGTAWIYRFIESSLIAANCHKLPPKLFRHELLSVSDITDNLLKCILNLLNFNPGLKIIFTVSPVRHWKEGAVNNQRSKSILFNSIHSIIENNDSCFYFPAYELMMDDLRDYRFYTDDLLHPTEAAVDYIFEKFSGTFFNAETIKLNSEINAISRMINHKPFFPHSSEYDVFKEQITEKVMSLSNKRIRINLERNIKKINK